MLPNQLRTARLARGWSQQQAAARLGVTQAYLSMLEHGRRDVAPLARRLMRVYDLPPTALPIGEGAGRVSDDSLARQLAGFGYPGFSHLRRHTRQVNPAQFLLTALAQPSLDARVAEALPWVLLQYPELPTDFLVREARVNNLQNRLGFVVSLARRASGRKALLPLEQSLAESKLEREDSLGKQLNDAERRWLRAHRSEEAKQWNMLSDLRPEALRYAD